MKKLVNRVTHKPSSLFASFFSLLSCALISLSLASPTYSAPPLIGISQIVEHPALDAVYAGIEDALTTAGLKTGQDYQIQHKIAQGNMATNVQIAQQLAGLNPKVLVAISTPSAQALASATQSSKTPVVFAAVTDPKVAKLTFDHITGVSDKPSIAEQIAFIKKFMPQAKRIGVLYNPGEINAVALMDDFKTLAQKEGIEVRSEAALKTTEVMTAAKNLIGKVDLVYIPLDNTVASAIDGLIRLQKEHHLPVITSDEALVQKGALAAVGTSYFKAGQDVGKIIIRLLHGENPKDIPVVYPENPEIYIHEPTAQMLNIAISEDMAAKAHLVGKK